MVSRVLKEPRVQVEMPMVDSEVMMVMLDSLEYPVELERREIVEITEYLDSQDRLEILYPDNREWEVNQARMVVMVSDEYIRLYALLETM